MRHIALHDADNTRYHNLALMKLSAWHKAQGDEVERYIPLKSHVYDKVYSSKVFSFTVTSEPLGNVEKGGIGYGLFNELPEQVEHICPDYNIFGSNRSMGFLTRGCIRKCSWCIVPIKEGGVRPHADIEEFLRHDEVIVMDNNILACDHGIQQIEKMACLNIKVDVNQGLDARLIDDGIARRLAKLRWLHPIRLACDHKNQMAAVQKAVTLLRWHNAKPSRFFVYVLVKDLPSAFERVKFIKGLYCEPFAQPYRDFQNNEPTQEQKDFARWVNHTAVFNSVPWEEYRFKRP